MQLRITRREWVGALGAAAASAAQPAPAESPASDARTEPGRRLQENLKRLAAFPLPPATEPAVVFRP